MTTPVAQGYTTNASELWRKCLIFSVAITSISMLSLPEPSPCDWSSIVFMTLQMDVEKKEPR